MRQWARREAAGDPRHDIVAEHQSRQHVATGAIGVLTDRQYPRQYLHCRLSRDKAQPLAQLDRPSGNAVQQRRGTRIGLGPAVGIDCRRLLPRDAVSRCRNCATSGRAEPARITPSVSSKTSFACCRTALGYLLPARLGDKLRQAFDLLRPFCGTPRGRPGGDGSLRQLASSRVGEGTQSWPSSRPSVTDKSSSCG